MKNLILPFVVVTLFAVGSCGDEAVQPSVNNPNDTTGKQDTTPSLQVYGGSVEIKNVAVLVQEYTEDKMSRDAPSEIFIDSTEKVLSFGSSFSGEENLISVRQAGDTLFLTDMNGYQGASNYNKLVLALIIDTVNQVIKYMDYQSDESYYQSQDVYSSRGNAEQHSLTLHNVPYSRTDSTIIIKLLPSANQISRLDYSTRVWDEKSNGKGLYHYKNNRRTMFLSMLPFRNDFIIEAVLRYRYK